MSKIGCSLGFISLWNLLINFQSIALLFALLDPTKFNNIENGITIFSDDGKSLINNDLAEEAFKEISNLGGAIFQHCEKSCHSSPGDIAPPNADNGLIPIDNDEELEVLERDINLSQKYGTRYHAQHLSTYESVQIIKKAKGC